nr:MAG TPA: hypothetical protein [Bacteriophage sp.]
MTGSQRERNGSEEREEQQHKQELSRCNSLLFLIYFHCVILTC